MSRLAVLSNVNMNFVIRMLSKDAEVYQAEGYGNELGTLLNPASSYHSFGAEYTFLVMDLCELLEHDLIKESAKVRIDRWFAGLEGALKPECIYYISDAYLWCAELQAVPDAGRKAELEGIWLQALENFCAAHGNVRILPYRHMIECMGEENAFSAKMWYMGKILLTNEAQKRLCALLSDRIRIETGTPKKLLILDLDNTLWGGLAGENDLTPIELSEEHAGLAYKNLQRVILQMQRQGVLLAIVSKNNEEDALEILEHHPHMVLRSDVFAAKKINWRAKDENIRELAAELNLGLDSFVFWDDNPAERELVRRMLPEVAVPDFPKRPEELADAMVQIYREFFRKPVVTAEDLEKTVQYAANGKRKELEGRAESFDEYLEQLEIRITRVDPAAHEERLVQLVNKTNQFNLTTRRFTQGQMSELLREDTKKVFLYSVADRFGDSGIVAALIVDLEPEEAFDGAGTETCGCVYPAKRAVVEEFVMSCRVMGKNIENAVLEDVEREVREAGFDVLEGVYLPTQKNQPVAKLYERLGYERVSADKTGEERYILRLAEDVKRDYRAVMMRENTVLKEVDGRKAGEK